MEYESSQTIYYDFNKEAFLIADKTKKVRDEKKINDTSVFREFVSKFTANKGALIGFFAIILICIFALFAPFLTPYQYDQIQAANQNLSPRIPGVESLGIFNGKIMGISQYEKTNLKNTYYFFGTDTLGRDLFARTAMGTRISLFVVAVMIDMFIGVTFGLVSGFFGGVMDLFMQRIIEILSGIPSIVVVTLLMIVFKPGLVTIILALVFTNWIGMSKLVRALVLKQKEQEYILAAKTLGASDFSLIFKEILPNIFGSVIVMTMMSIPGAIFMESFLSFLGLGIPEPMASLGTLVSTGYKKMMIYPYMIAIPVTVFVILMLSFNLVADGLRDALDPKMKNV